MAWGILPRLFRYGREFCSVRIVLKLIRVVIIFSPRIDRMTFTIKISGYSDFKIGTEECSKKGAEDIIYSKIGKANG